MHSDRTGQTLVLFLSTRTGDDEQAYDAAAEAMERLAESQPGYRGMDSVRGADGRGMTASWWASEADAVAWRAHAEHSLIREMGRARWYAEYEVVVSQVTRGYRWSRHPLDRSG